MSKKISKVAQVLRVHDVTFRKKTGHESRLNALAAAHCLASERWVMFLVVELVQLYERKIVV